MNRPHVLRRLSVALGAAGLALIVPTLGGATGGGGPTASDVIGSGDTTSRGVLHALDRLYLFSPGCQAFPSSGTAWLDFSCKSPDPAGIVTTENYDHDQVHQAPDLTSSTGIAQLCHQGQSGVAHIDYARSSRPASSTDCAGLHSVAYATDGVSWEAFDTGVTAGVHSMNNVTAPCGGGVCLTQAQLQAIFLSCTITNWNQVGGQNQAISLYTAAPGTGTRANWDHALGGDSSRCIPAGQLSTHVLSANLNTGVAAGDLAGAILPFSTGSWNTGVGTSTGNQSVLGKVDNVAASTTTVANGSFPFTGSLYNVYCTSSCPGGASSAAATSYVGEEGWICKPNASHTTNPATGNNYRIDIANAITAQGFAPLSSGVIGGGDSNSDFCRLVTAPSPVADFETDHKTDWTVFRPSTGYWFTDYSSGAPYSAVNWGASGDITVSADFDGTGQAQQAIFRPSAGTWFIRHTDGSYTATPWGNSGDIPVPADYDGAGRAQIAVFRPGSGTWFILHNGGSYTATSWGASGDIPVPADYDGAGRAQVAVFRPTGSTWFVLHASGGYIATAWGASGDIPVPADYDGAGQAQITVFRPSSGTWFTLHAGGGYSATVWGVSGDIPVPGDYNADGRADTAVFRPSAGIWYVLPSGGGSYTATSWGGSGDQPVVLPAAIRNFFF